MFGSITKFYFSGVIVLLLIGCVSTTPGPSESTRKVGKITNYETAGNLAATMPTSCVEINELSSSRTPADIYPGIADCLSQDRIEEATKLYALAFVYGRFDQQRVADRTAHQATRVLELEHLATSDQKRSDKMLKRVGEISESPEELHQLCAEIRGLGRPTYFPAYMIQHGMGAVLGRNGDGLNGVSESDAWEEVLDDGLHCPA